MPQPPSLTTSSATPQRADARIAADAGWLTIIARVGLSSLLLPVLLISSLLSFPASCQCGAELPHTHALFGMAGHTHAPTDSGIPGDPGHPHADDDTHTHAGVGTAGALAPLSDGVQADAAVSLHLIAHATDMQRAEQAQGEGDGEVAEVQPTGSAPAAPVVGLLLDVPLTLVPGPGGAALPADVPPLAGLITTPEAPPPRAV